jgi:hypothetical protein
MLFVSPMDRISKAVIQWLTPDRLNLYPPHIPAITFILYALSQYLGPGLSDVTGRIIGSDFLGFYTGGTFFLTDRIDELYDVQAQYNFQCSIYPFNQDSLYYFFYPPFTVLFFSIFSMGSYAQGLTLWWACGLLAIWGTVRIVRSELECLQKISSARLIFMCFLFFPSLCWFMYGQNTAFSLFLYALTFVALRRGNDFSAGMALGMLLYKPQLMIGLVLAIVVQRRWRAIGGLILATGLWIAAGFAIAASQMMEYARLAPHFVELLRLRPDASIIGEYFILGIGTTHPVWGIHSMFGFLSLLLDNMCKICANYLYIATAVLGAFCIMKLWYRKPWNPGSRQWDFAIAISLVLGLLVSPQLFTYDLMLLLLPLAILWGHYPEGTMKRPLDGGPLLFWSAMLYVFSFLGAYLSLAQLKLLAVTKGPIFAVQFTTLILVRWAFEIYRKCNQQERGHISG